MDWRICVVSQPSVRTVETRRMNRQDAADAKIGERKWSEPTCELDRCAHQVIGAAIAVHRHLGPGFLETVSCVPFGADPFVHRVRDAIILAAEQRSHLCELERRDRGPQRHGPVSSHVNATREKSKAPGSAPPKSASGARAAMRTPVDDKLRSS